MSDIEYTHIEEVKDDDAITCQQCKATDIEPTDFNWNYEDGEEHEFKCKCGNDIMLRCDRPIHIQVLAREDGE